MDVRKILALPTLVHIDEFGPGDLVSLSLRIVEGDNQRLQAFKGNIIRGSYRKNRQPQPGATFTVRRIAYSVGVERTIPFHSTNLESVKLVRRGKVRRARIYYLRKLAGKKARIKEQR